MAIPMGISCRRPSKQTRMGKRTTTVPWSLSPRQTRKGTARNGQEYISPLLVLTGEAYAKMPFQMLLEKLEDAIRSGPRVVIEYFDAEGHTHIFREDRE